MMDEQQQERIGSGSPSRGAPWERPQVDRLVAGAAETGPSGDIDGGDTQS